MQIWEENIHVGKDGLSKQDTNPEVIKEQTDTLHKI